MARRPPPGTWSRRLPLLAIALALIALALALLAAEPLRAAEAVPKPTFTIHRAAGAITIDGDLSDAGWQGVTPITQWYETNVGDNVEPQVKNVGYLTYDDRYFYAGFQFEDPDPNSIRAPLGDHDAVNSPTDYAGVIVDSRNDGKTAQMFLANPRGVQYDAISSDATGEDNSPDFFWESVGKITATGWNLEIRIPFSSLRYDKTSDTWGILLYRNYPRDRRYQFFSARLPKDVNCFICNETKLAGLAGLPHGSHLVAAPFETAQQTSQPKNGLGTPLSNGAVKSDAGLDLKWSPSSGIAIDGTLNPDFSQVESDAAQIVANQRFALFFPEKRPFFLEGVDMLSTPIQAVYTRTITSPSGGVRATGKIGATSYTALITEDQGGGLVILPGPFGSRTAHQDFSSDVGIVRLRHDLGRSFVSVLATGREIENGGHNVVAGPDFSWRPRAADSFTGQMLWSASQTPQRSALAGEWDGRHLSDHAAQLAWSHGTPHLDWYVQGQDFGKDFRADDGFIPQVGYREGYFEAGYTIRPQHEFLSRVRFFTIHYVDTEPGARTLDQRVSVGAGMDGKLNSFVRIELNEDHYRVGGQWLERFRPRLQVQASPGRLINQVTVDSYFGDEIDFDNGREGKGATITTNATLRPSDHLELRTNFNWSALNVNDGAGRSGRLFTADVERLRATWSFSSRAFVRLIGQYVRTTRDTLLYTPDNRPYFPPKQRDFDGSALVAYKLNWQTVVYLGYGDSRTLEEVTGRLVRDGRQAFAKVSYAWQQ